jgi:hypothetical protein
MHTLRKKSQSSAAPLKEGSKFPDETKIDFRKTALLHPKRMIAVVG